MNLLTIYSFTGIWTRPSIQLIVVTNVFPISMTYPFLHKKLTPSTVYREKLSYSRSFFWTFCNFGNCRLIIYHVLFLSMHKYYKTLQKHAAPSECSVFAQLSLQATSVHNLFTLLKVVCIRLAKVTTFFWTFLEFSSILFFYR